MYHTTLYRAYRPQTFEEVLGQERVVRLLQGALAQGRVGHAYLFEGIRGTGKTSVARIFARALGIHERDVYEIDAASNNGVEEMRTLTEEVSVLPLHSERKLYILDEAHMLSKSAWNAFLKTLEEPPAHVMFILATTEPERIPETIHSRCERCVFETPRAETLSTMVLSVAEKEGYLLEKGGADIIALSAQGSFRDAFSILQAVLASAEKKTISTDMVAQSVGAPTSALLVRLLEGVAKRDAHGVFSTIQDLERGGVSLSLTLPLLLAMVRAVLTVRLAPALADTVCADYTPEERVFLEKLAREAKDTVNSALLLALLDAQTREGTTRTTTLPLESALFSFFSA
jgi:DNA polymerase-3 subunit gamma/tau